MGGVDRADRQPGSEHGGPPGDAAFFIDNLLVRVHFNIVMVWWTGLAPWEFEFLGGVNRADRQPGSEHGGPPGHAAHGATPVLPGGLQPSF